MQATYNLRYRKSNLFNKILLTKEGEVILDRNGLILKGKGAADKGDKISFTDIKELYVREESMMLVTFAKEKYTLNQFSGMYDEFLLSFYQFRNDFLSEALFMKQGDLQFEYEGKYEYMNRFNKPMHKGPARIQIYAGSIVVLPAKKDAFVIPFNFLTMHEFEEMEYSLKCVLDNGSTIFFHQLGSVYDQFQEHFNLIAAEMYQRIVNKLKNILPEFDIKMLLKLGSAIKEGKAVSLKKIQKIDKDLAKAVEDLLFANDAHREKVAYCKSITSEENINYGICVNKYDDFEFKAWYLVAIPEKNCVIFEIVSDSKQADKEVFETFVFQIIMERGVAFDKVEDKTLEINQTMLNLNWDTSPFWQDKRQLRKGPFKYAIRKLPYLRILRKSFVEKFAKADVKEWKAKLEQVFERAKPRERKRVRHGMNRRPRRK